jgi:UPF0716 protein FxsA
MFVLLLLALAAEVVVLITVGQAIGALTTIALLVVISLAGMALLRRQGARTMLSFTEALRARRDPQPELVDGMLLALAGALVVFPGFVSDAAALLLLFPPTRSIARNRILTTAARRAQARPQHHDVVDGEVVTEEPAPTPPPVIEGEITTDTPNNLKH